MKKFLLGALITLTGLFALAAGAQAQTGGVVVHIQQDFIAGGKMLPAGTYRISQDLSGSGKTLLLRGERASAFLLPIAHDASSSERLQAKLTRVGDVYYLSQVATDSGVFTLPEPPIVTRMAKAKDLDRTYSSGSN
jgi:hypothetical protein